MLEPTHRSNLWATVEARTVLVRIEPTAGSADRPHIAWETESVSRRGPPPVVGGPSGRAHPRRGPALRFTFGGSREGDRDSLR